jgi:hypothetical protein
MVVVAGTFMAGLEYYLSRKGSLKNFGEARA